MEEDNHYKVLGIRPLSSSETAKIAYRKLAKKTHPDLGNKNDEFLKISKAYAVLADPLLKAAYDMKISSSTYLDNTDNSSSSSVSSSVINNESSNNNNTHMAFENFKNASHNRPDRYFYRNQLYNKRADTNCQRVKRMKARAQTTVKGSTAFSKAVVPLITFAATWVSAIYFW